MAIDIRLVRTSKERREFLTFPWTIYRDDPLWVPPLLSERAKVIDPEQGAFFKQGGEAEFFIAWQDGVPVGTICTAEDHVTNAQRGTEESVFGFFECVDDYAVAEALFRHVLQWAERRQLKAIFGPFNLDYEDAYGVLVEGRDRPPVLLCGHTPPYYLDFFERFGFESARGDNLAYAFDLSQDSAALQHLTELAEKVRQRERITIRNADLAHWEDEIDRVHHLLNHALNHLPDAIPWQREALEAILLPFRNIVDPELILFAEVEGQTVGWFPGIPNLNEVFQHVNGLRYPWNYVKLVWLMRRQPACLAVKSVLVLPEYWGTGIMVLFAEEMIKRARARGYAWLDLSLTSEDNPQTPILANRLGAKLYKRYRTYRMLIP